MNTFDFLRENVADLAVELLGEPARKTGRDWRWRGKGSLSVVVEGDRQGAWKDHESDAGGGPIELIARELSLDRDVAIAWAREWVERRTGGSLST